MMMKMALVLMYLKVKKKYPNDSIIFCNGGDRNKNNIPEMIVEDIEFKFELEAKIKNSSSWILKDWKYDFEKRVWGIFYNLFDSKDVKVKELIVKPKKGNEFSKT